MRMLLLYGWSCVCASLLYPAVISENHQQYFGSFWSSVSIFCRYRAISMSFAHTHTASSSRRNFTPAHAHHQKTFLAAHYIWVCVCVRVRLSVSYLLARPSHMLSCNNAHNSTQLTTTPHFRRGISYGIASKPAYSILEYYINPSNCAHIVWHRISALRPVSAQPHDTIHIHITQTLTARLTTTLYSYPRIQPFVVIMNYQLKHGQKPFGRETHTHTITLHTYAHTVCM